MIRYMLLLLIALIYAIACVMNYTDTETITPTY